MTDKEPLSVKEKLETQINNSKIGALRLRLIKYLSAFSKIRDRAIKHKIPICFALISLVIMLAYFPPSPLDFQGDFTVYSTYAESLGNAAAYAGDSRLDSSQGKSYNAPVILLLRIAKTILGSYENALWTIALLSMFFALWGSFKLFQLLTGDTILAGMASILFCLSTWRFSTSDIIMLWGTEAAKYSTLMKVGYIWILYWALSREKNFKNLLTVSLLLGSLVFVYNLGGPMAWFATIVAYLIAFNKEGLIFSHPGRTAIFAASGLILLAVAATQWSTIFSGSAYLDPAFKKELIQIYHERWSNIYDSPWKGIYTFVQDYQIYNIGYLVLTVGTSVFWLIGARISNPWKFAAVAAGILSFAVLTPTPNGWFVSEKILIGTVATALVLWTYIQYRAVPHRFLLIAAFLLALGYLLDPALIDHTNALLDYTKDLRNNLGNPYVLLGIMAALLWVSERFPHMNGIPKTICTSIVAYLLIPAILQHPIGFSLEIFMAVLSSFSLLLLMMHANAIERFFLVGILTTVVTVFGSISVNKLTIQAFTLYSFTRNYLFAYVFLFFLMLAIFPRFRSALDRGLPSLERWNGARWIYLGMILVVLWTPLTGNTPITNVKTSTPYEYLRYNLSNLRRDYLGRASQFPNVLTARQMDQYFYEAVRFIRTQTKEGDRFLGPGWIRGWGKRPLAYDEYHIVLNLGANPGEFRKAQKLEATYKRFSLKWCFITMEQQGIQRMVRKVMMELLESQRMARKTLKEQQEKPRMVRKAMMEQLEKQRMVRKTLGAKYYVRPTYRALHHRQFATDRPTKIFEDLKPCIVFKNPAFEIHQLLP